MDQTYIHLLANHVPVIGSIFGLFVLIYGMSTNSYHTKNAAYFIFLISAIGGAITYLTGEAAEETVENIAGISKEIIETHEETGELAFISILVLGFLAALSLILSMKKAAIAKLFSYLVLVTAMIAFGITAYTAFLGGKIRHTEIDNTATMPAKENGADEDDHD